LRSAAALILGNALGYGLFRLAAWSVAQLWRSGPPQSFGELLLRLGLSAMAFGAPPVIVGALAAAAAGRYEPWIGLGAALWGFTARFWWPAVVPLLPPESWVAPMTLILVSGLVGGWLVGSRSARSPAGAGRPAATPVESSKDSVI
jgi:hypothetical protein